MPNTGTNNNYEAKLKELQTQAEGYIKTPDTFKDQAAKSFLDDLKAVKEKNDEKAFQDKEAEAYEKLIAILKNPAKDTIIHKAIKKRAMDALENVGNNLDGQDVKDAQTYNDLYVSASDGIIGLIDDNYFGRTNEAEKKLNREIQKAIDEADQEKLDKSLAKRNSKGFVEERKQFQNADFEEGKLFQSCRAVVEYTKTMRHKQEKTDEEIIKYTRLRKLRNSELFRTYMKVTHNRIKYPQLYKEDEIKKAFEESKKQLADNLGKFEKEQEKHVNSVKEKFKKFNQSYQLANASYYGKQTKNFGEVISALEPLKDYKWNNYEKDSIDDAQQKLYADGLERALNGLDRYIQRKSRFPFLNGKLGRERLAQAQGMRDLLNEIQTAMTEFGTYAKNHKKEVTTIKKRYDEEGKENAEKENVEKQNAKNVIEPAEIVRDQDGKVLLFDEFEEKEKEPLKKEDETKKKIDENNKVDGKPNQGNKLEKSELNKNDKNNNENNEQNNEQNNKKKNENNEQNNKKKNENNEQSNEKKNENNEKNNEKKNENNEKNNEKNNEQNDKKNDEQKLDDNKANLEQGNNSKPVILDNENLQKKKETGENEEKLKEEEKKEEEKERKKREQQKIEEEQKKNKNVKPDLNVTNLNSKMLKSEEKGKVDNKNQPKKNELKTDKTKKSKNSTLSAPKTNISKSDGFTGTKPAQLNTMNINPSLQNSQKPVEDEKTGSTTTNSYWGDTSNLTDYQKKAIKAILNGDTWLKTVRPVQADSLSYKAVKSNREKVSFDELNLKKSNEKKEDLKKKETKSEMNIRQMRSDMEKTKKAVENNWRPREAEDIREPNFVSKRPSAAREK